MIGIIFSLIINRLIVSSDSRLFANKKESEDFLIFEVSNLKNKKYEL